MFGGMNPRQMQKLMNQMGIKNVDVPAKRVVIEKEDGSQIVVSPASVVMVEMQGSQSFQISGTVSEQAAGATGGVAGAGSAGAAAEGDVEIIMRETGASKEKAQAALDNAGGDLAQAILDLQGA
ncbi:MAG: nascent polypeptide-associated complex protein [Candidatus Micrarchaeia archaeon]|jgi:nascent polypeptide-associated complex subunit alpha